MFNRREVFIAASFSATRMRAEERVSVRLEEWWSASRAARKRGLELCLERIRRLDPAIRAWVQVLPQPQTADGALSGIPFGAKDVLETRKLVTEYGSPIYKGRMVQPTRK